MIVDIDEFLLRGNGNEHIDFEFRGGRALYTDGDRHGTAVIILFGNGVCRFQRIRLVDRQSSHAVVFNRPHHVERLIVRLHRDRQLLRGAVVQIIFRKHDGRIVFGKNIELRLRRLDDRYGKRLFHRYIPRHGFDGELRFPDSLGRNLSLVRYGKYRFISGNKFKVCGLFFIVDEKFRRNRLRLQIRIVQRQQRQIQGIIIRTDFQLIFHDDVYRLRNAPAEYGSGNLHLCGTLGNGADDAVGRNRRYRRILTGKRKYDIRNGFVSDFYGSDDFSASVRRNRKRFGRSLYDGKRRKYLYRTHGGNASRRRGNFRFAPADGRNLTVLYLRDGRIRSGPCHRFVGILHRSGKRRFVVDEHLQGRFIQRNLRRFAFGAAAYHGHSTDNRH